MNEIAGLNVSRETMERLETYADLLARWNPKINLVSKTTLPDLWTRHIVDSAQLFTLAAHPVKHWVDMGSGGGFPGLVIAIIATEHDSPKKLTLIESDTRKSAFLRTVIRETGVSAVVLNDRIEKVKPLGADILSARALADLPKLLGFAERHMSADGTALLLKGASWKKELQNAQSQWKFDHEIVKSLTETGPVILRIKGVSRV